MNKNKNNQNISSNKWFDYYFEMNNKILTDNSIKFALNKLLNEQAFTQMDENQIALIQFKILYGDDTCRSISYLQSFIKSELDILEDVFIESWHLKSDEYLSLKISQILFSYNIQAIDSEIKESKFSRNIKIKTENKKSFNYHGNNLPTTMDYMTWGDIIHSSDNSIIISKAKSKAKYYINIFDRYIEVELKIFNKVMLKFKDTMNDKYDLSTFTRTIDDTTTLLFKEGNLTLKKLKRKTSFITPILPSTFTSSKFITMDLETRNINEVLTPYCVSIYDGKNLESFYLSDYKDSEDLLTNAVLFIMKRKYDQHKVYLHNFSHFDGVFLLKILSNLSDDLKPVMRDGRFIDLKFSINNNKYSLYFRDSYLLLPSSLKKLAISFNVEKKGTFPIKFVNDPNISLDYNGPIPDYSHFIDLKLKDYKDYCADPSFKNNQWNLRSETIKYCNQDVVTLYQIIDKFGKNIFKLFRIDILKYPTLSSLAFAIYRSKFMGKAKIPIINGDMYYDIKKGYTGGYVDVIKPYGENIYRYDVNSLYPFVMLKYPMPVGNPTYFEGNILEFEKKPFGIFNVEVTTPKDLKVPLLQIRHKTINGTKTIAPIGTWNGTYFSEELYNAAKYGYSFKILNGYLFDQDYIFKDYVDFLYDLKVKSKKDSADYTISKLLLNSLYGRLGMTPDMEYHKILSHDLAIPYYKDYVVTNVLDLKNGKELISFFDGSAPANPKRSINISIPISSAVTAYARIHMSQFKTMTDKNLYYTDTDSIDIDAPLDNKFIGTELGKMKLEHIFKEAIFLAPKVYGGYTSEYEYVKVKGLKTPVPFKDLLPLQFKDSKLEIEQEKWYRNFSDANITIKNEIYTLSIVESKRKLIYDNNNKFIDTKPLILNNGELEND